MWWDHKYELLPGGRIGPERVSRQRQLFLVFVLAASTVILTGLQFKHRFWTPVPAEQAKLGDWIGTDALGRKYFELGQEAEDSFKIGFIDSYEGTADFFRTLWQFTETQIPAPLRQSLLAGIRSRLPPSHQSMYEEPPSSTAVGSMWDSKTIFMTNKDLPETAQEWADANEGWIVDFYSDQEAEDFVNSTFPPADPPRDRKGNEITDISWAWHYMNRGVLKADLLRYLLPLVKGGAYVDSDTMSVKPVTQWGANDVEWYDLNRTDGSQWRSKFDTPASLVVGIDVDVHADLQWSRGWPRPLGICQWALGSASSHPAMLEAVRRVVRNTAYVRATREYADTKRAMEQSAASFAAAKQRLELEGWATHQIDYPLVQHERPQEEDFSPLSVINWTGPGVFTDAVLAYLLARYRVNWKELRGLTRPLRIGDVLVLPITAFSPGGYKDFGAGGIGSPQNVLVHMFKGSWKGGA